MFNTNPYAQAGWSNPQNSNSINNNTGHWNPSNPPAPSVYGALPFAHASQPASILTFRFVSLNPNILNCTILGPQSQPYFRVVTDMNNLHGDKAFTFVENSNGKITSVVHWSRLSIEVTDIVPKQRLRDWLALSSDGSARQMRVGGRNYIWAPQGSALCLYTSGSTQPELLGKVSRGNNGSVQLEISTHGISSGLLEASIVAVVLLQCGRNID